MSEKKHSSWYYIWRSEDIRRKLLITFGLVILFRFLLHFPLPGIVTTPETIRQNLTPGSGLYTFLDFLSILSGSSLLNVSVLALGLLPYNMAGVLLQLAVPIIPALQRRFYYDPYESRRWMARWTYYLAIPVAILESLVFFFFISPNCSGRLFLLESQDGRLDLLLTVSTIFLLTAGSFFSVWIAELISEFGIRGQGNAILIVSGIIGRIPEEIVRILGFQVQGNVTLAEDGVIGQLLQGLTSFLNSPEKFVPIIVYALFLLGCIYIAVYLLQGRRNIPVMYPSRRLGIRSSRTPSYPLPLMLSAGKDGLIGSQLFVALATFYAPLISCVAIPWVNGLALSVINIFDRNNLLFSVIVFPLVVGFTFFYSDMTIIQQNYAENLRRSSARIPGVNPGAATEQYLRKVNRRITLAPALMLGMLAVAPSLFSIIFNQTAKIGFSILDGEILLIIVTVIKDVFYTVDVDLKLHGYYDSLLVR